MTARLPSDKCRMNVYIACENMNFLWDFSEVEKFGEMWRSGIPIDHIAKNLGRSEDEVALLAMDRAKKRRIKPRKGGVYGNGYR